MPVQSEAELLLGFAAQGQQIEQQLVPPSESAAGTGSSATLRTRCLPPPRPGFGAKSPQPVSCCRTACTGAGPGGQAMGRVPALSQLSQLMLGPGQGRSHPHWCGIALLALERVTGGILGLRCWLGTAGVVGERDLGERG